MGNKVKFGLKNVHYSLITTGEDGATTYGTPKPIPGAVSLTLDAQGEEQEFEADDGIYWASYGNTGYKGTLEVALIPDSFREDVLGEVEDKTDHVLMEYSTTEAKPFALLYEVNGDEKATRRVLYSCAVSRPGENASTTGKTKTPTTDSMSITAIPRADGLTRARTKDNTVDTVFNNWYKAVWVPKPAQEAAQSNAPVQETGQSDDAAQEG